MSSLIWSFFWEISVLEKAAIIDKEAQLTLPVKNIFKNSSRIKLFILSIRCYNATIRQFLYMKNYWDESTFSEYLQAFHKKQSSFFAKIEQKGVKLLWSAKEKIVFYFDDRQSKISFVRI